MQKLRICASFGPECGSYNVLHLQYYPKSSATPRIELILLTCSPISSAKLAPNGFQRSSDMDLSSWNTTTAVASTLSSRKSPRDQPCSDGSVHWYARLLCLSFKLPIQSLFPVQKDCSKSATDVKKYRGVAIAAVFNQLPEAILLRRNIHVFDSDPFQLAYKRNSSCTSAVPACSLLSSATVVLVFLDASKGLISWYLTCSSQADGQWNGDGRPQAPVPVLYLRFWGCLV